MTTNDLLKHFGTQAAIAKFFSVSPTAVSGWFAAGKVPMRRQYEAQVRTAGVLFVKSPEKRAA